MTREVPAQGGLLAGVDEAGLGPILGPLVVAGVALEGPKGADPWKLLQRVVSRRKNRTGRIRVADSKKVKQGAHGLGNLELTALSFLCVEHGRLPETLDDLLHMLGTNTRHLQRCPWYGMLDLPLPLDNDAGNLELKAWQLEKALDKSAMRLRKLAARPVDVEEFNKLIEETDNKSDTHFHAYASIIGELLGVLGDRSHLVADRCGGRVHYLTLLKRHFPKTQIRILEERPNLSRYNILRGKNLIQVSFVEKGEDRAFPTALASCLAKYVREAMMESLNRWFRDRIPDLRRTAGYYVDGHRFLDDVGHLPELDAKTTERLVRVR